MHRGLVERLAGFVLVFVRIAGVAGAFGRARSVRHCG